MRVYQCRLIMIRFFLVSAILLSLVYASCTKSAGPSNVQSVRANNGHDSLVTMTAAINGTEWRTDSVYGYRIKSSGNDSLVNLMITATNSDSSVPSTIVFNIANYAGPNTYPINPPVNCATYYIGNARHYATSGEIVVVSNDEFSLIGNFSFTAGTFNISGEFNVANP
jgi:hypothetical protein